MLHLEHLEGMRTPGSECLHAVYGHLKVIYVLYTVPSNLSKRSSVRGLKASLRAQASVLSATNGQLWLVSATYGTFEQLGRIIVWLVFERYEGPLRTSRRVSV